MRNVLKQFLLLFLIIIVIPSLILFLTDTFFRLKTVYLEANNNIVTNINLSKYKRNLIFLPLQDIKNYLIEQNSWVKDVYFEKHYPDSLIIKIIEREPLITVSLENKKYYVDIEGKVLSPLPQYETQVFAQLNCSVGEFHEGGKVSNQSILLGLKIISQLQKDSKEKVKYLECQNKDIEINFEELLILVSPDKDANEVISSLQFLLKQFKIEGKRPKKIDLRFEKAVLIPEGLPEENDSSASANF